MSARRAWRDAEARAQLQRYEGIVKSLARRLTPVAALGHALDEDDLCAEGRVAVLEALSTYQGFGIQERTWVRTRVKQRMIDAIRRLDLRSRDEARMAARLATSDSMPVPDRERARQVAARHFISFDTSRGSLDPLHGRLSAPEAPSPQDIAIERGELDRLRDALSTLPERSRVAIELALFQGMSLKQIGQRMSISESRVCQLQKRAVERLRQLLAEQTEAA